MNPIDQLTQLFNQPLVLLEATAALGGTRQLKAHGMVAFLATTLGSYAKTYFGATSCSRLQADTLAAIEGHGLDFDYLHEIEKQAARIKDERAKWRLRHHLATELAPGVPLREFARQAREHTTALLPTRPKLKKTYQVQRNANDLWKITIIGEPEDIDRIEHLIKNADDPARELLDEDKATVVKVLRPVVTIPLDALDTLIDGTGDEAVFACSDGIRRTSTQLARSKLEPHFYVGLIHPVEGPVDLVRTSRFPNEKQRILAKVESPACVHPTCNKPADHCQIHHIHPWNQGGTTTSSNLTVLCPFHNGRNDDDPTAPKHGRVERIDGAPVWVYPPWHHKAR